MACKKFSLVVVMVAVMFLLSENVSAMTFSQPVKIGSIVAANMGGFGFKQVSQNDGVMNNDSGSRRRQIYNRGVARFDDGGDALYFHYKWGTYENKYQDMVMAFGSSNINNTISVSLMVADIFQIKTSEDLPLYMIHDQYDLPEEHRYVLIGKKVGGVWVKYFDTIDITKKYFGESSKVWSSSSIYYDNVRIVNDTIILDYQHYNVAQKKYFKEGEFRFKWDDKAQWFGVEKIVY